MPPSKPQITLQHVAEATGLSRMSVSLALRNSPRISTETKRRILAKAAEMGYRPNPMVSALMAQLRRTRVYESSSVLAYLTAHPTRDGWKQGGPGWDFYLGAKARAESLGFGLEVIWAKEPGMTGKRLTTILHTRNISGLLVAPMARDRGHLSLDWDLFSSVALGYSSYRPNLHRTAADTFHGTLLVLRKLWHRGYRRIGFVLTQETDTRTNFSMSGAYVRFQYGLKRSHQMQPFLPQGNPPINAAFIKWFHQKKPDAILSIVPEVRGMLHKEGIEAPRDYGLAILSVPLSRRGIYAGLDQRYDQIGAAAVDLVSKQIFNGETGIPTIPLKVLIEGAWVDGPTVRPQN